MSAETLSRENKVLLIGMMGAGKTTVGEVLASRLGYPFFDSDEDVMRVTGRTVTEIFDIEGEESFRSVESEVLLSRLSDTDPAVISVAGGAVLDPHNASLVSLAGTVVWLRAKLDTLVVRIGDASSRPLLRSGPREVLARLSMVRNPLYESLANVIVDVDELQATQIADLIIEKLGVIPC